MDNKLRLGDGRSDLNENKIKSIFQTRRINGKKKKSS